VLTCHSESTHSLTQCYF